MRTVQYPVADPSKSAHLIEESRQFDIDGARYLALKNFEHAEIDPRARASLVTVVPLPDSQKPEDYDLQGLFTAWAANDDVFRTEYSHGVVFLSTSNQMPKSSQVPDILRQNWGTTFCLTLPTNVPKSRLPIGPHLLEQGKLYAVYRLYDDVNGAFMTATKPYAGSGPYQNLRISGDFYQSLSVAVPARKPPTIANKGPLDGLRFAVKDIFDIEGLRVTAGNRAFYSLSNPAGATAPLLQRLVDNGAHLVGTLKLGSLIAREEPTESVDFHAPFNPRADGYQSAWSSSGGSGAAIAAYDWLDFTLGTDTTGSSRRPAMANGCFQIRLSQDALPLQGTVASYPRFDSPALFGRDVEKFEGIIGTWTRQQSDHYEKLPIAILYLTDFLPLQNQMKMQMQLIDKFIADLEMTFRVQHQKVSLAAKWKESAPEKVRESPIKDYLKDVGVNSFCYGVYHVLDDFRTKYESTFHKKPYVNPVTQWRWDVAEKVSKAQNEDAVERLDIYKKWLLEEVLQVNHRNTLVIEPISNQAVDYREDHPDPSSAPGAFDAIWLAPILSAPEISIPIGEMEYHSRVSGKTEYLPLTVSLMGPPGSDMTLIRTTVKVLQKSGRPTRVSTGSRMFDFTTV